MPVTQSQAEAYKWYLIAAKSGDAESKSAADRLKPDLGAQTAKTVEAAAAAFRPAAPSAKVMTASR